MVLTNYVAYVGFAIWALRTLSRLKSGPRSIKSARIIKVILSISFLYLSYSAFLMVLHPDTSDLVTFTRNYAPVILGIDFKDRLGRMSKHWFVGMRLSF